MTINTTSNSSSSSRMIARQEAFADALAGVVGSVVALWTFYPMDVWKTQRQCDCNVELTTTNLKWTHWFAGIVCKTAHTTVSSFTYFYLYSWISAAASGRRLLRTNKHASRQSGVGARLLNSAVAAAINTFLTLPLDVLSSRRQVRISNTVEQQLRTVSANDAQDADCQQSTSHNKVDWNAARWKNLLENNWQQRVKAILSLWKGLWPSLLLCINPAIHYTVYDSLKHQYLLLLKVDRRTNNNNSVRRHERQLGLLESFFLGLIAKSVATIVTYPLIRAKTMLMVGTTTTSSTTRKNRAWIRFLVHDHQRSVSGVGVLAWYYKGLGLQLVHASLKSALLMMTRERIAQVTTRLIVAST
jgi:hypothetical protein